MSKPHEYSKIEQIKDTESQKAFFSIPYIREIKKSNKKIQFLSFLSEWCPNCEYEAIELIRYINKYNSLVDFSIVMMFSSHDRSDHFISNFGLNSELIDTECLVKNESLNKRTSFFKFRTCIGDSRKWGVPLHVIRVVDSNGERIFSIKGETVKKEIRNFLNKNLKKS